MAVSSGGYLYTSSAQLWFLAFLASCSGSTHTKFLPSLLTGTDFQFVLQPFRVMALQSIEQHFWDSSRYQAAARATEQVQRLEIQPFIRTGCHAGRRCCRMGRGGSSNILPNRVWGGLEVLLYQRAGANRVWWRTARTQAGPALLQTQGILWHGSSQQKQR